MSAMLKSEFIERTGFNPTADEYANIEENYYKFDGNKDEFCKKWKKDGEDVKLINRRAAKIAELEYTIEKLNREYSAEVQRLQTALDKELEWKPCRGGTNVQQSDYLKLRAAGEEMSDAEAAAFIADECGFAVEKIEIVHEVATYESNKYRQMRKSGTFERVPVYTSTDWNYVRFNCAHIMYEFDNGDLRFYEC